MSVYCGAVKMKNPFAYIGIPIGLLIFLWIFIEIRHRASKQRQKNNLKAQLPERAQERMYFKKII